MTVSFDPAAIDLPRGHFIAGAYVAAPGGLALRRPSDGARFAECPIADAATVDRAVSAAKRAVRESGWALAPPRDRARALHRFADLIEANAGRLAEIEAVASTRPVAQVLAHDIPVTAEQIRFFAEFADKEGGALAPTGAGSLGLIVEEPYGVVAAITPWNFPLSMAAWKFAPALAAGNAVVLKPSEMTPFSSLFLAELAVKAGLPAGLFNVVLGDGPNTGAALVAHRDVGKVSFTGSTGAGEAILANIARHGVKPVTLELGGKSPQVVFADADLALAAGCIAGSILYNAGQACVAGSRVIVAAEIADELTQALLERMRGVEPGLTWDAATTYAPIISKRQIDRVGALVDAAIAEGAQALAGARAFDRPGYFYAPTLLTDVDSTSPAVREEIFGPVLSLQTFASEEEALALADHPTYGLAAGLYTRDLSRALRVMRRLEAGTVWINRYGRSRDHILPTGGYKASGVGKDLGREAYHANLRSKTVLIDL